MDIFLLKFLIMNISSYFLHKNIIFNNICNKKFQKDKVSIIEIYFKRIIKNIFYLNFLKVNLDN
jgi:hypothetical protein